ncbi:MAG TPA: molybdenum ABC transporter ATP-binding protein [Steroidobacteraceae bacterium]
MLRVAAIKRRAGFTLEAEFEAPTPGVVALFGRSGCGKTTLINLMSGLLAPDEARIHLDETILTDTRAGISVPVEERRIGYVFQDARLFPHFSVLGNLRYGLKRSERRAAEASPTAGASAGTGIRSIGLDEVVDLLGLRRLLDRRPHQLSGGERQRVGLGRALLCQPRLLLLDEPLASLDIARREEVLPYLEALRDRLSIPMVYVSHQFEEVLQLATHVVLMEAGRVVAHGSLSEISVLPELRAIVGPDAVGSVLDGVVTRVDPAQGMADIRLGNGTLYVSLERVAVGARIRVQLLARDIILANQKPQGLSVRNELEGVVRDLTPDGHDGVLVRVDVGGDVVLSRITTEGASALELRPGSHVWVLVKAVSTRGHAFRAPEA